MVRMMGIVAQHCWRGGHMLSNASLKDNSMPINIEYYTWKEMTFMTFKISGGIGVGAKITAFPKCLFQKPA